MVTGEREIETVLSREGRLGETEFMWDNRRTTTTITYSDRESIQGMERDVEAGELQRGSGKVTFTGLHSREDRSPRADMNARSQDGVAMELNKAPYVASDMAMTRAPPMHPVYLYEKLSYLDSNISPSATPAPYAYANFVHATTASSVVVDPSDEESVRTPPPVAIPLLTSLNHWPISARINTGNNSAPGNCNPKVFSLNLSSDSRSSEFLMAISSSVRDAVVQEHGPSGMSSLPSGLPISSEDDDEDEAEEEAHQVCGNGHVDGQLRAAICDHPLYPEMVLAHIRILKIGAPSELHAKLNDVTKKFQRFYEGGRTPKLGQDPDLDHFMKSYVGMLTSFREHLEEPFNEFMQFMDQTTKDLEDLCGHYVETKPEEESDKCYGFDIIGPIEGDREEILAEEIDNNRLVREDPTGDVDESVVVDPDASEEELKRVLMRKYGRHIPGLQAEFNRVRKKGKLPSGARQILKDWFNLHSYWPYPSEMEKATLQRLCDLNLKQINNWFINERKRHWSSEERSTDPGTTSSKMSNDAE